MKTPNTTFIIISPILLITLVLFGIVTAERDTAMIALSAVMVFGIYTALGLMLWAVDESEPIEYIVTVIEAPPPEMIEGEIIMIEEETQ